MPIPLRPNAPLPPGYGPRRMSHMPQRYYGGMPYQGYNQPQQMGRPMMARNNGNGNRNGGGGGGLLAKILGRGKTQQNGLAGMMSSMNRSAPTASGGGGILKTLTNPDALNGLLNNTQTLLKTAQQFGPVIQQYGPLVRNIPSLWKLYKGLKDATSDNEQVEDSEPVETSEPVLIEDDELVEINPIMDDDTESPSTRKKAKSHTKNNDDSSLINNRRSVPRLYI